MGKNEEGRDMSKELIERLRADAESTDDIGLCADAADCIEELEREIERKMSAAAFILKERDAMQADNARLRAAMGLLEKYVSYNGDTWVQKEARNALAATSEQSLAEYRNKVIEECAVKLDPYIPIWAKEIRAMKEQP